MSDAPKPNPGAVEGDRRKLSAHATLEARRDVLISRARRVFVRLLLAGAQIVTADDLRDRVDVPESADPRFFGVVPGPLARAGIIRPAGYRKSIRPEAHARPVTAWELADGEKAQRWLATHPEPVDATPAPDHPEPADAVQGRLF